MGAQARRVTCVTGACVSCAARRARAPPTHAPPAPTPRLAPRTPPAAPPRRALSPAGASAAARATAGARATATARSLQWPCRVACARLRSNGAERVSAKLDQPRQGACESARRAGEEEDAARAAVRAAPLLSWRSLARRAGSQADLPDDDANTLRHRGALCTTCASTSFVASLCASSLAALHFVQQSPLLRAVTSASASNISGGA